ncbi:MAG: thymidylate synthase [Dethiobacteria bacterium]
MAIVKEQTIEQAWRMSMWSCARYGYSYKIEKGSYEGQVRKQLDHLTVFIENPGTRPLAVTLPENSGIPAPTSDEKIQAYFYDYLATDTKGEKEDYTYGQYISRQLSRLIDLLNISGGATNQACMNIGDQNSIELADPPCLRVVDFKVVDGRLTMSLFFRSWDLFAGFPENLGGLQLLKEYILMQLTFPVEDGPIIAYSSGAHIYEQYFPLVNMLNIHQC